MNPNCSRMVCLWIGLALIHRADGWRSVSLNDTRLIIRAPSHLTLLLSATGPLLLRFSSEPSRGHHDGSHQTGMVFGLAKEDEPSLCKRPTVEVSWENCRKIKSKWEVFFSRTVLAQCLEESEIHKKQWD